MTLTNPPENIWRGTEKCPVKGHIKSEVIALIKGHALKTDDIHQAIQKNSCNLAWDYIMIDESQNWPKDERDILYSLYDHKIFVIADGIDQMVRGQEQADWRYQLDKSETQVVSLRKSLRLKENICRFVRDFSEEIEYDWDVEPEPESWGGRVIIAVGNDYLKKSFHEELFSQVRKDKNALIDMLFCVPPSWVKHNAEKRRKTSRPGDAFEKWGYQTWDAVDNDDPTRKSFPTELNQLRIVQYDSCRGLEGWTVVTYALDTFFEYKQQSFVDLVGQDELFVEKEDRKLLFAKRWLMIPLTRAIDTLVLHIESKDSYVGKALSSMKGRENIIWKDETEVLNG